MKVPTIKDIRDETQRYQQYLDSGGKPIEVALQLIPKDTSLDWIIEIRVQGGLPEFTWIPVFVDYIKEQITTAIQPPKEGIDYGFRRN